MAQSGACWGRMKAVTFFQILYDSSCLDISLKQCCRLPVDSIRSHCETKSPTLVKCC